MKKMTEVTKVKKVLDMVNEDQTDDLIAKQTFLYSELKRKFSLIKREVYDFDNKFSPTGNDFDQFFISIQGRINDALKTRQELKKT